VNDTPVLTRVVDTAHLPPAGIDVVVEADEAQRKALADAYDLLAVNALAANATLTPGRRGTVTIEGRVTADIAQSCVVSLVPVDQHIEEPFSVRFASADSPDLPEARANAEVVIDPAAPDPPEVMDGTRIDVGALVEELFVLAIDPYPHAPGATLPAEPTQPPESIESPFAVLAKARTKKG
jgi:hypothetical protein